MSLPLKAVLCQAGVLQIRGGVAEGRGGRQFAGLFRQRHRAKAVVVSHRPDILVGAGQFRLGLLVRGAVHPLPAFAKVPGIKDEPLGIIVAPGHKGRESRFGAGEQVRLGQFRVGRLPGGAAQRAADMPPAQGRAGQSGGQAAQVQLLPGLAAVGGAQQVELLFGAVTFPMGAEKAHILVQKGEGVEERKGEGGAVADVLAVGEAHLLPAFAAVQGAQQHKGAAGVGEALVGGAVFIVAVEDQETHFRADELIMIGNGPGDAFVKDRLLVFFPALRFGHPLDPGRAVQRGAGPAFAAVGGAPQSYQAGMFRVGGGHGKTEILLIGGGVA